MKARVTVNVDGCEAASHEFDADLAHFRENKPAAGSYRLRLMFEKNMDRIEIFGGTAVGGDRQMIVRVDRGRRRIEPDRDIWRRHNRH